MWFSWQCKNSQKTKYGSRGNIGKNYKNPHGTIIHVNSQTRTDRMSEVRRRT